MGECTNGSVDGWLYQWVDGWIDGWMNGWKDGWTDGWTKENVEDILVTRQVTSNRKNMAVIYIFLNKLY